MPSRQSIGIICLWLACGCNPNASPPLASPSPIVPLPVTPSPTQTATPPQTAASPAPSATPSPLPTPVAPNTTAIPSPTAFPTGYEPIPIPTPPAEIPAANAEFSNQDVANFAERISASLRIHARKGGIYWTRLFATGHPLDASGKLVSDLQPREDLDQFEIFSLYHTRFLFNERGNGMFLQTPFDTISNITAEKTQVTEMYNLQPRRDVVPPFEITGWPVTPETTIDDDGEGSLIVARMNAAQSQYAYREYWRYKVSSFMVQPSAEFMFTQPFLESDSPEPLHVASLNSDGDGLIVWKRVVDWSKQEYEVTVVPVAGFKMRRQREAMLEKRALPLYTLQNGLGTLLFQDPGDPWRYQLYISEGSRFQKAGKDMLLPPVPGLNGIRDIHLSHDGNGFYLWSRQDRLFGRQIKSFQPTGDAYLLYASPGRPLENLKFDLDKNGDGLIIWTHTEEGKQNTQLWMRPVKGYRSW